MSANGHSELDSVTVDPGNTCILICQQLFPLWLLSYRKLIHHRKETLARRNPVSSQKQGLSSSTSEIALSHTPPPPNGLNQDYGRQGSVPLSGSLDNMQGEQGFYQVKQHTEAFWACHYSLTKKKRKKKNAPAILVTRSLVCLYSFIHFFTLFRYTESVGPKWMFYNLIWVWCTLH